MLPAVFFAASPGDHGGVTAVPVTADRHARLLRFASRLRRRHLVAAARAALVRCALVLAVPTIALAWWLPARTWSILAVFAGVLTIGAALAAWRARCVTDARLLAAEGGDSELGCGLATWLERRRAASAPMAEWLAGDLERDIAALPASTFAAVGRRRLGRLRWLLPIVLLLLLAWLLSLWLQPPWPGALGGRPDAVGNNLDPAPGVVFVPDGTRPEGGEGTRRSEANREPRSPQSAGPDPDEPAEAGQQPAPPEAPAPLLLLPRHDVFVVPEFTGEGPTTRVRVHAAEVAAGGAVAPHRPTGSAGDATPPPPEPESVAFERAAERAQRARHVPPRERAIVRRFFTLLREAAK